jgi:hypothetical protein
MAVLAKAGTSIIRCNSLRSCAGCGSPCVFVVVSCCAVGLEQPCRWNTCVRLKIWSSKACWIIVTVSVAFSKDWHKIWCILPVPFSDPSWKSPRVTYMTPNKRRWKLPTSTQLRATLHTDSLDMVFLSSTSALRYHNCWIDGGISPEYFRRHLVLTILTIWCYNPSYWKRR